MLTLAYTLYGKGLKMFEDMSLKFEVFEVYWYLRCKLHGNTFFDTSSCQQFMLSQPVPVNAHMSLKRDTHKLGFASDKSWCESNPFHFAIFCAFCLAPFSLKSEPKPFQAASGHVPILEFFQVGYAEGPAGSSWAEGPGWFWRVSRCN